MPRCGTLVICVQNLDFSGANQVMLNIVFGSVHTSNVVVLSPKLGTFAARFVDSGAAVRVGDLKDLLVEIRDVFCILCNTIMTAPIVVDMASKSIPVIWILHEWWDDEMILDNLKIRNYQDMTLDTVKKALNVASMIVFVCESQRLLYKPTAKSTVIFVGVPDPLTDRAINNNNNVVISPRSRNPSLTSFESTTMPRARSNSYSTLPCVGPTPPNHPNIFTFLCLGIICPRKNQLWTIHLFKEFSMNKDNVRLQIVGARYTRVYEIEYLEQVKKAIDGDPRIELYDVTDNVDPFYENANCLIITSLNEVTPMVISECFSWGLPVLSTNIAGIKEMYTDGVEGFLFDPDDELKALDGMEKIYCDRMLKEKMCLAARERFETFFDLDIMVQSYRELIIEVAPPVILLDMDGCLVNWDKGFRDIWNECCPIDRSLSYYMEDCILDASYRTLAEVLYNTKGFFEGLEPMEGAIAAIHEMKAQGLHLYICTSPLKHSPHCAQEKIDWVTKHLGPEWVDALILCQDKTIIVGDVLVDDKPLDVLFPKGRHTTANWRQVVFDAPYNQQMTGPRMMKWNEWEQVIMPLFGKIVPDTVVVDKSNSVGNPDEASDSGGELKDEYTDILGNLTLDTNFTRHHHNNNKSTTTKKHPLPSISMNRSILVPAKNSMSHDLYTDCNYKPLNSIRDARELQHGIDLLNPSQEPLTPESIATIISGSYSLMNNDEDIDIIKRQSSSSTTLDHQLKNNEEDDDNNNSTTTNNNNIVTTSTTYEQKKKLLEGESDKRRMEYKKKMEDNQREEVHQADEADGVHLFRRAYASWFKKEKKDK